MALEKILFDAEGGIKVVLTPELVVHKDSPSYLVLVPVMVMYGKEKRKGNLVYDLGKRCFITALTDFFPEADNYNREQVHEMAKLYSFLLERGNIKVKEMELDDGSNGWKEHQTYDNFHDYQIRLAERHLDGLKKSKP